MDFSVLITVLRRSQMESLPAMLASICETYPEPRFFKIHLIHYPSMTHAVRHKLHSDFQAETIQIPKRTNLEKFLLNYMRFKLKGDLNVLLLDPSWGVLPNLWEDLFIPFAEQSDGTERIRLYMNRIAGSGSEFTGILNSLFDQPFAVMIPHHLIQQEQCLNLNPTKGWILPYHTLFLRWIAQGQGVISDGNYFAEQLARRGQGSWAVWKQLINLTFMKMNPKLTISFHNAERSIRQFDVRPAIVRQPLITILMSVYNEGRFIEDCLQSLAFQTNVNFNTIIVDDASTDETQELLNKWESQIPNCQIIRQEKNSGKGAAMNLGLSHVNTRYVLELDGDDWLDPDAVEVISKRLFSLHSKVVYAYGDRRVFTADESGHYHRFKSLYRGKRLSKRHFILNKKPYGPRLYLTSALRKVGGWPVTKEAGNRGRLFEDFFLVTRLLFIGKFVYWPRNPIYNIRSHRNSQSVSHLHELNRWLKPYINKITKKFYFKNKKKA